MERLPKSGSKKNSRNQINQSSRDIEAPGHITRAAEPVTAERHRKTRTRNPFRRVAEVVGTLVARMGRSPQPMESKPAEVQPEARQARSVQRKSDIPMEMITQTYSPHQTSVKSSFRDDGLDQFRSQEFAGGFADERWNEEDVLTNKSGDPRIGTHRKAMKSGKDRNDIAAQDQK